MLYQPAMDKHLSRDCHAELQDMSVGEMAVMVGNHLLWKDRNADEFMSWSISMLFVIEHVLGRSRKGQMDCHICVIDSRELTTVATSTSTAGRPTSFYPGLELWKNLNIIDWKGWGNQDLVGLHPRKFTHEVLSHGVSRCASSTFRHVTLENLLSKGLFEMYPEFVIPDGKKSTGLYERCVALRQALFPREDQSSQDLEFASPSFVTSSGNGDLEWGTNVVPLSSGANSLSISQREIELATEMASCFANRPAMGCAAKAPLHIFLMFLGLRRRPRGDPLFMRWISKHYYRKSLPAHITDFTFVDIGDSSRP